MYLNDQLRAKRASLPQSAMQLSKVLLYKAFRKKILNYTL